MTEKKHENLNENQEIEQKQNKHGGKRSGAGRPLHSKNPSTIEREEAIRQFKDRVAKNADKLYNAQYSVAVGTQMLFVIKTDSKGERKKPELVTSQSTIQRFLDENEGMDGTLDGDNSEYYFITTAAPDNRAIESLLNRTFGRAKESVDLTSDGERLGVTLSAEQAEQLLRRRAKRTDS